MRALWTSASGLNAQQMKLDTIANNVANINTHGYKAQNAQFKDLLYAQFEQKADERNLTERVTTPGLRIGQGVRVTEIDRLFLQGSLQPTQQTTDFAIEGEGFFNVGLTDGNGNLIGRGYTRDGSFKVGVDQTGTSYLVDSNAYPVLGTDNRPINVTGVDISTLSMDGQGRLTGLRNGEPAQVGQLNVVRVNHPDANLEAVGNNLFRPVVNFNEADFRDLAYNLPDGLTRVVQGSLEMSNVDMSKSMSDMIVAQRAYSMNARAIQTADEMMGLANNLRS